MPDRPSNAELIEHVRSWAAGYECKAHDEMRALADRLAEVSAQLDEAVAALRYYAAESTWAEPTGYGTPIRIEYPADCGKRAREVLARLDAGGGVENDGVEATTVMLDEWPEEELDAGGEDA